VLLICWPGIKRKKELNNIENNLLLFCIAIKCQLHSTLISSILKQYIVCYQHFSFFDFLNNLHKKFSGFKPWNSFSILTQKVDMKKIVVLFSCIILIAVTANAQDKKDKVKNLDSTHKENLKEKGVTKNNLKDLDLSKDQQKQIDDIHSNAKKEKEKIKNDSTLTEEQKKDKIKQIEKDSKTKVNGLLTPEQKEKLKKNKANAKEQKTPGNS
jgi:protein CpxP